MVRQAIDARLAFGADAGKFLGGSKLDGSAGGSNKCVAKIVVVEKTMNVAAEYAAGFIYSAVGNEFCFSLALNVRERVGSAFVESFTDVDLVTFEPGVGGEWATERIGAETTSNTPDDLFCPEYGSHRQKIKSGSYSMRSLILDAVRIFNKRSQHLKAAADADDGHSAVMQASKFLRKTSLLKPFKIVQGLLAAGQYQYIGCFHFAGALEKRERDRWFERQRIEVGKIRHMRQSDDSHAQRSG